MRLQKQGVKTNFEFLLILYIEWECVLQHFFVLFLPFFPLPQFHFH